MKIEVTLYTKKKTTPDGRMFDTYFVKKLDGTFGDVQLCKDAKTKVQTGTVKLPAVVSLDSEKCFLKTVTKEGADGETKYTKVAICDFEFLRVPEHDDKPVLNFFGVAEAPEEPF